MDSIFIRNISFENQLYACKLIIRDYCLCLVRCLVFFFFSLFVPNKNLKSNSINSIQPNRMFSWLHVFLLDSKSTKYTTQKNPILINIMRIFKFLGLKIMKTTGCRDRNLNPFGMCSRDECLTKYMSQN